MQGYGFRFAAVEQKLGVGHQRSTQPPGGHVPDAKIADHRTAEGLGQVRRVADLQSPADRTAQIIYRFRNVVNRLTVAADQIDVLDAGLSHQLAHRLGVKLPQPGAQQTQPPAAAGFAAGDVQNFLPGLAVKGQKEKAQLADPGVQTGAGDFREDSIHTVGGGAAHQPHHQPGGLSPEFLQRMFHRGFPFPVFLKL